jgi:DnaK suppressor protein
MSDKIAALNVAYVEAKRQQLLELRTQLQRVSYAAEAEEAYMRTQTPREAREYEDDAEELDLLERQGLLVNHSVARLARIERALAKIANGTYGYSDESGERIPNERLESTPDAIDTLREQRVAEKEAQ